MVRFRTLRSALKEVVSEIHVRPDWKREVDDWVRARKKKRALLDLLVLARQGVLLRLLLMRSPLLGFWLSLARMRLSLETG